MKYSELKFTALIAAILLFATAWYSTAHATAKSYEAYVHHTEVVHLCGLATGSGTFSGKDYSNCKGIVDGDLFELPANAIVEGVTMMVDTSITGTTALTIGDDDDADGFATDVGTYTAGIYFNSPALRGPYLRSRGNFFSTATGSDLSAATKYYSAAGKEVKLDVTTANTAGRARVFIDWYQTVAP